MSSSARVTIEPALAEAPKTPKRRKYSIAEKRRIVEESFQPGSSVARVARAHEINANQVFSWRRLYQRGRLGGNVRPAPAAELLPVTISDFNVCSDFHDGRISGAGRHDPAPVTPGSTTHRRRRGPALSASRVGMPAGMITVPTGAQIWIAAGFTDLRRGFDGLGSLVQMKLEQDPFGGHVFVFRGRRGDLIKVLWWDGDGLCNPSTENPRYRV